MASFPEPPPGYKAHQEASTQILIKLENEQQPSEAFINPVQEYNRDLSIAAIKAWSSNGNGQPHEPIISGKRTTNAPPACLTPILTTPKNSNKKQTSSMIRPLWQKSLSIIANDLSPSAVALIKANITHNGLDPGDPATQEAKVRVTQGDACDLMYSHRPPDRQFDVVDLVPYGTAAPFIDAAVQCVRNGGENEIFQENLALTIDDVVFCPGLLRVTRTDLAVLAGSAYPEKWSVHQQPLFQSGSSWSGILFWVPRVKLLELWRKFDARGIFTRVCAPASDSQLGQFGGEVRQTDHALTIIVDRFLCAHLCPGLQSSRRGQEMYHALGRTNTKPTKAGRGTNASCQNACGPPMPGATCEECGGKLHVAGLLWSGPLHDPGFCDKILEVVEADREPLKTAERIRGMVGLANCPFGKVSSRGPVFFFTPAKLWGLFKCTSPSLLTVGWAILNAGFTLSRSYCQPGSIKTDAPRAFIHDLMKTWIDAQTAPNPKPVEPAPVLQAGLDPDPAGVVGGPKSADGGDARNKYEEVKDGGAKDAHVNDDEVKDGDVRNGEVKGGAFKDGEVNNNGQVKDGEVKEEEKSAVRGTGEPIRQISEACRAHGAKNSTNPRLAGLLSRPCRYQVDLSYIKQVEKQLLTGLEIVRYQANPAPNWKARALKK
ncbi:hypothetical protein PtB15_13B448 [Puccinia triticina]|nr:hypothetical protein PtB15_13B448 [Puccinia triticina]